MTRPIREAVPGRLNLVLTGIVVPAALALLWAASHTRSWTWRIAAAVAFSYVNNTIFSLLHEAVHGIFHRDRRVNDAGGRLLAAFFPTGYTFQRLCHLGHHRRNRSDVELFDYVLPGESRALKAVQWYGILTGVYWLLPPHFAEDRPSFLRIYLRMWRGPRPWTDGETPPELNGRA